MWGSRMASGMKVTILSEFALLGSEGGYCAERGIHAETKVGIESMAYSGNCRELRMEGSGMCKERERERRVRPERPLYLILRSLDFFLVVENR